MAALDALTARPVTEWPKREPGGRQRGVQSVYAACQRAGLTAQPCASDVQRLHAVFNVAASSGLASLIVDYVALVCSDPFFTSRCRGRAGAGAPQLSALTAESVWCSDPVEASLMDGHCVQRWCCASLESLSRSAAAASSAAFAAPSDASEPGLLQLLNQAASLVAVLDVLEGQQRSTSRCGHRLLRQAAVPGSRC